LGFFLADARLAEDKIGVENPDLRKDAAILAAASLATSTRKTYSTGQRNWLAFAKKRGFPPFPLTETSITLWVANLARTLKPSTVDTYLAAVLRLARDIGYSCDRAQFNLLRDVLRGVKNLKGHLSLPLRKPIDCATLRRFAYYFNFNKWDDSMLWAAMTLGTLGLLRSGEFALDESETLQSNKLLRIRDVSLELVSGTPVLRVTLRHTKTDVHKVGVIVTIGYSGKSVCAVTAMIRYLLFRKGASDNDPLFVFSDGVVLRRNALIKFARAYLVKIGENSAAYAGHSFRIGGATDLASRALPDHEIQAAGRWTSDAFKRYVRFADERNISRARVMCADIA